MDYNTKDMIVKLGTVGAILGGYVIYDISQKRKEKTDELVNDIHKLMSSLNVEKDGYHIKCGVTYVMISTDVGHIIVTVRGKTVTVSDCDSNETRIKISEPNFMGKIMNAITIAYNGRYNSEIAKILGKGGDIIDE